MRLDDKPCLTIYDIPDEESGSIINVFASIIRPIIFYKLHKFTFPTIVKSPNLDKELYQRILPQSSGYDSEPPKNINKKTTKSCAYKKFENYCNEPKSEKEVVDVRKIILNKAIQFAIYNR